MQEVITSLLRTKQTMDGLKALNQTTLTQAEREAVQDSLSQAYDRAAYFLPLIKPLLEEEGQRILTRRN